LHLEKEEVHSISRDPGMQTDSSEERSRNTASAIWRYRDLGANDNIDSSLHEEKLPRERLSIFRLTTTFPDRPRYRTIEFPAVKKSPEKAKWEQPRATEISEIPL
jgi:hypothetical protein